jgi:hypothetical protein
MRIVDLIFFGKKSINHCTIPQVHTLQDGHGGIVRKVKLVLQMHGRWDCIHITAIIVRIVASICIAKESIVQILVQGTRVKAEASAQLIMVIKIIDVHAIKVMQDRLHAIILMNVSKNHAVKAMDARILLALTNVGVRRVTQEQELRSAQVAM